MDEKVVVKEVKRLLKVELKKKDTSYERLAELLNEKYGLKETTQNINSKINRGTFTAIFLYQCFDVIGCKILKLDED